jgi:PIN domain nuclease of toxin-antitoxin system
MKVLVDTHAFLWLITGDARLSTKARDTFLESKHLIYLSAVSLWEISIKLSLGKLELKKGWLKVIANQMRKNLILWLPIEMVHCELLTRLPFHHRDPFDRDEAFDTARILAVPGIDLPAVFTPVWFLTL